jgi:signal transduction histidine kinase
MNLHAPRRRPLVPRSWLRLPRRTARLRLTLLYGGLFLVCGAALLAITYGLVRASVPATVTVHAAPTHVRLGADGHPIPRALGHEHKRPPGTARPPADRLLQVAVLQQKQIDLNHELLWSAVALALMALVSIGLGWYIAGRVRTITRTARAISARNLGERLALAGPNDEFKELADTLDELFARLQAAFDSQRHFVANASHELRTPLTVERSLLQVALADPNPTIDSLLSTCQNALLNSEQHQHLIDGLLTLASSESGLDHHEPLDLAQLAEQVLLTPRSDTDRFDLAIETVLQPALTGGDPRLLERLVSNLIENAVRHNTPRGRVEITTGTRDRQAFLTVVNTGPAIPPDELQRLFQPFQRLNGTRTRHKTGHGLGLSIVTAIATAHSATLTADPRPQGGLAVRVSFPETGLSKADTATTPQIQIAAHNESQPPETARPQTERL